MCGIFGVIHNQPVLSSLLSGLEALSYRGYDSAGIAMINKNGLERRRSEGKLARLVQVLKDQPLEGTIGIAHTRWATHGAPTKINAHPHMTTQVAVAHNGIIENCESLRSDLEADGYQFQSETDSETIPLLITRCLDQGMDHNQAIQHTTNLLKGSFAIAAVFNHLPDQLFAARRGSPLVLGKTSGGYYLASDINALRSISTAVCHLQDGDMACISRNKLKITDVNGNDVKRDTHPICDLNKSCGKQGYRHYMQKEIHEQPAVLQQTIEHYINSNGTNVTLPDMSIDLTKVSRLSIIACGTSYYAGLVGKYWIESLAKLPVDLDIASEYRYRQAPIDNQSAAIFISQSGETADTLAALNYTKEKQHPCLSVVNVDSSSIARESDGILPTLAGPEIGVASTKAFTAQLSVLLMFTLAVARLNNKISDSEQTGYINHLQNLSVVLKGFLHNELPLRRIAAKYQNSTNMLYLGRGIAYPLALEGALKLKEISYIHAEAYPAGELKHGPIALVDSDMPVVIIAPPNELFDKTISNLREVKSRGAKVILVSNQEGIDAASNFIDDAIVMPDVEEILLPILYALPLQLLAYHIAILRGTDVDQPRNLAKSVTVE